MPESTSSRIVEARAVAPLRTTADLVAAVKRGVPRAAIATLPNYCKA
jgi:16S rRNA C1402 N4-methylase RsmH